MNKSLTKPYEKNVRLSAPTGLLGVPPEAAMLGGDTYIIVTNDKSVKEIVDSLFASNNNALSQ